MNYTYNNEHCLLMFIGMKVKLTLVCVDTKMDRKDKLPVINEVRLEH